MPSRIVIDALRATDDEFSMLVAAGGLIVRTLQRTAPFHEMFGAGGVQPEGVTHFTVRCYEERVSFSICYVFL